MADQSSMLDAWRRLLGPAPAPQPAGAGNAALYEYYKRIASALGTPTAMGMYPKSTDAAAMRVAGQPVWPQDSGEKSLYEYYKQISPLGPSSPAAPSAPSPQMKAAPRYSAGDGGTRAERAAIENAMAIAQQQPATAPKPVLAPQITPDQQAAFRQKLAQDELLRAASITPRGQMAQPESGYQYPPAPQQGAPAYQPYEANYPAGAINPGRGMAPTARPSMPQAAAAAGPTMDSSTTKAADKGMHYWIDKGDGSPLMPYYSKTGEKPDLPGVTSFADPNYKPFFGLFGG